MRCFYISGALALAGLAAAARTSDAAECSTTDLSPFSAPTPTSELQSAITSWLQREPECTRCTTALAFCGISTALSPSLASEYSSYGSACSSWVVASSSAMIDLSDHCLSRLLDTPDEFRNNLFVAGEVASCFGAVITDSEQNPTATNTSPSGASGATSTTAGGASTALGWATITTAPSATPGTSSSSSAAATGTRTNGAARGTVGMSALGMAGVSALVLFGLLA